MTDASATALPIDATGVSTIVVHYAGDFNHDDQVDAADLSIFALGFGAAGDSQHGQGDATSDGAVDGSNFLIWQRQLGRHLSSGVPASVPKPHALCCGCGWPGSSHRGVFDFELSMCWPLLKS